MDVDEALELAESIISTIEDELNTQAREHDYIISVEESVRAVIVTIEENDHVTEAQMIALNNWESDISAWVH